MAEIGMFFSSEERSAPEIVDAGFDEVHVGHIGADHDGFVDFYAREALPHFDPHSDQEEP